MRGEVFIPRRRSECGRLDCFSACLWAARAFAQDASPGQDHAQHDMQQMGPQSSPWMVMTDGALFAFFNHQGGDRGGTEFKVDQLVDGDGFPQRRAEAA